MILSAFVALIFSIGYTQAVGVGGLCNATLMCTVANSYCSKQSACSMGYCVCSSGYGYNYNQGVTPDCEAEKLIGDSCTSYCTAGTCIDGTCACSSTETASSDKRSCMGKKLGDTCSTSSECQGYNRCSTTCQCDIGYKQVTDYICLWYSDGEACTPGITVCGNLATCTSGTCQCKTVDGIKYEWYIFYNQPVAAGGCVHPSATKNVGYGQPCTTGVVDATAKLCSSDLYCSLCPEDTYTRPTNNYKCLSGVGQIRASYLVMVATLVLGIKLFIF